MEFSNGLLEAFAKQEGGEPQEETQIENTVSEEVVEEVVNEEVVNESTEEVTEQTTEENPVAEAPVEEVVENKVPSRFSDRFQNLDELESAINKEVEYKDEFIKKVVDAYNEKGDLTDFFKAYATDWENMAKEEVLKQEFFDENKDYPKEVVEKMWIKEMQKLTLDPDEYDEDEIMIHDAKLDKRVKDFRSKKLAEREQYLQPKAEQQPQAPSTEQVRKTINALPEVKQLSDSKKLSLKLADGEFNYSVDDTGFITESMADVNSFMNTFAKDGKADVGKFIEVAAYAQNPEKMRQAFVDYGKSLGREEIEQELKNPRLPTQQNNKTTYATKEEGLLAAFANANR